jgi:hypothetical protein
MRLQEVGVIVGLSAIVAGFYLRGPGVSLGALCSDGAVASGSDDQVTDRHQHTALVTRSQGT